ncbi:MAG: hypothetical protein AAFX80_23815 [Cyanobacteria bacterium J06639_18]
MKKYISFLPFVFVIVFVVIVSSVFLPQIKVEITVQPQSQSIVKAEKAENTPKKQESCLILYGDNINKVADNIRAYRERGYQLINFSATSTSSGITGLADSVTYYAPVCKE